MHLTEIIVISGFVLGAIMIAKDFIRDLPFLIGTDEAARKEYRRRHPNLYKEEE